MRKVKITDDEHFVDVADCITSAIRELPADVVSKYENGTYRATPNLIHDYIQSALDMKFGEGVVSFGELYHKHNIGNNNREEIIFHDVKNNEEQMCGYLNINKGLYGECYVYVTDINDNRGEFALRKITGCDKNSNFDMSRNRFSGFEDKNGWYNSYIFRESEREIQEASAEKPQKSSRNSDYER